MSERLSGWWKDVMKWCDMSSVDELTAKLWPDATSLLRTDWMIDKWDVQSLINGAHWQIGTLGDHFTGDVCQKYCLENDTLDTFIFYLYRMWMFFTLTWGIVVCDLQCQISHQAGDVSKAVGLKKDSPALSYNLYSVNILKRLFLSLTLKT